MTLRLLCTAVKFYTTDNLNIGLATSCATPKEWVEMLKPASIPLRMFVVRYDRSSGPGGQHVNKVNSKCTLILRDFSNCSWFPEEVRKQIKEKAFRYYARSSDSLVIQSDETRSREINRQICLEKFVSAVKASCYFPTETDDSTLKKWDMIKKKSDEVRVRAKKLHSDKKKRRNKVNFTY